MSMSKMGSLKHEKVVMNSRHARFFRDLKKLCKKHGVKLWGKYEILFTFDDDSKFSTYNFNRDSSSVEDRQLSRYDKDGYYIAEYALFTPSEKNMDYLAEEMKS